MVGCLPSMGKEGRWEEGRKRGKEGREGGRKETVREMKARERDRKGGLFRSAHSQERASVNLSNLTHAHFPLRIPGALSTSPVAFTLCPVSLAWTPSSSAAPKGKVLPASVIELVQEAKGET